MSLHLILGAAGSGKTTQLLKRLVADSLAHPEKKYLLLTPEQAGLDMQRRLVAMHPRHALLNIEAISFNRLAARVFEECGMGDVGVLSETHKKMLLTLAVRDCRDRLSLYARQAARPGFIDSLSSLIAEWDMNDLPPERIRELADDSDEKLPPLLRQKLTELALLYERFRELRGSSVTAEEKLPRLARLLPESGEGFSDGLYLDGFTGFTSVQYRILSVLMRRTKEIRLTLTLPEAESAGADDWFEAEKRRREELFALSKESIWRLTRLAQEAGQKTVLEYAGQAPERPRALRYLTEHILRYPQAPGFPEDPKGIRLIAAEDPAAEAALAAGQIASLVRENGLRYRDIALVVTDRTAYRAPLRSALSEAGIPYFLDERVSLENHPVFILITDAVEAAQLKREAVLRFVKNPCGPLSREESDRFENYLLATGNRGGKGLREPFDRLPRKKQGEDEDAYQLRAESVLAEAEALRLRVIRSLEPLRVLFHKRTFLLGDAAAAILAMLERTDASGKLSLLCAMLREDGDAARADAWEAAMPELEQFLKDSEMVFAGQLLKREEFADILRMGLLDLSIGRLPGTPDGIVIGDVERSRYGNIRHLIFMGLNDDLLPRQRGGARLITDEERELLADQEEDLAYTDERALFEEQYYLYALLSKPREGLTLLYSRMNSSRQAKQPARLVKEIRALLPRLSLEEKGVQDPEAILSLSAAARAFAGIGEKEPALSEAIRSLLRDLPEGQLLLDEVWAGRAYGQQQPALALPLALELFGTGLSGSVTRLENYASCPYQHFLSYGIGLKERDVLEWQAVHHGTLFHRVMEVLSRRMQGEALTAASLDEASRRELVREALALAAAEQPYFSDETGAAYLLERWQSFFERYLKAQAAFTGTGFLPDRFEEKFGNRSGLPMEIHLSKGKISLNGTIDRIDIYEESDRLYVRVVDYKTGGKTVDFGQVDAGTQLQLAVYLKAALALYERTYPDKEVLPAGFYYAGLRETTLRDKTRPEKQEEKIDASFRLSGCTAEEVRGQSGDALGPRARSNILSREDFAQLSDFITKKIRKIGEDIQAGEIRRYPVSRNNEPHCTYCQFRQLCDRRDPDFAYHETAAISSEAFFSALKEKKAQESGEQTDSRDTETAAKMMEGGCPP